MSFASFQGGTSKKKTQKKILGRKVRSFCFWKYKFSCFIGLGLGFIMPYSFDVFDSLSSSSLRFLCGIGGSNHGLLVDKALLGVMVALEVHEKYESERGEAYSL